eukprot:gnl/Dysnectes_brevis/1654_a1881_3632.p1 GENE.gnl/Dysnectes_brevis/1654_a1881_3632~~gnl/Dysnectes_brevis/1654_a1881_3632.p1  ORF type:complete len:451 (+),score=76.56 gnl/Dysnectes_brevis/1654_a1881_3632:53-1405(+)
MSSEDHEPSAGAEEILFGANEEALEQVRQDLQDAFAEQIEEEKQEAEDAREAQLDVKEQEKAVQEIYDPRLDKPTDLEGVKSRLLRITAVLANFKARRVPDLSRSIYISMLVQDICSAYGYSNDVALLLCDLFGPVEFLSFVQACEKPRPLTIRVNALAARRRQVAQALIGRGANLDPLGPWSTHGLQIYQSQVPIGATPEYMRGMYFIQDAASLLPSIALAPRAGERVLDMAAAPGGKTTHLAALMKDRGLLVANEVSKPRLAGLQANLQRCGVTCALVVQYDGRKLPAVTGGFDRILLDAPCSGLGVISKDASVKVTRDLKDVQKHATLQRELATAAVEMLSSDPGSPRLLCYSTCSVSVAENESIVDFMIRKHNMEVVELPFKFGRPGITRFRGTTYHPSITKARRMYPHAHNTQGFFVCLLRKPAQFRKSKQSQKKVYRKRKSAKK